MAANGMPFRWQPGLDLPPRVGLGEERPYVMDVIGNVMDAPRTTSAQADPDGPRALATGPFQARNGLGCAVTATRRARNERHTALGEWEKTCVVRRVVVYVECVHLWHGRDDCAAALAWRAYGCWLVRRWEAVGTVVTVLQRWVVRIPGVVQHRRWPSGGSALLA